MPYIWGMILLADSGSTRCDWRWLDENGVLLREFSSSGFNPLIHSGAYFREIILQSGVGRKITQDARLVCFFGAGIGSDERIKKATKMLEIFFPAAQIVAGSDLDAAALASVGTSTGICCILGTGSNAGLYAQGKLVNKTPSLGYLIGDEGSGNYFGKILLKNYFYGKLPENLHALMKDKLREDREIIISDLYSADSPAAYLGNFGQILIEMKGDPWADDQLSRGIDVFFENQILPLMDETVYPLYVCGTVGWMLKDLILERARETGLEVKDFKKRPVGYLDKWATSLLKTKKAQ